MGVLKMYGKLENLFSNTEISLYSHHNICFLIIFTNCFSPSIIIIDLGKYFISDFIFLHSSQHFLIFCLFKINSPSNGIINFILLKFNIAEIK